MGGRFGKYGDLKRRINLRRSRIIKSRVELLRQRSRWQRSKDTVKSRPKAGPQIEIELVDSETSE